MSHVPLRVVPASIRWFALLLLMTGGARLDAQSLQRPAPDEASAGSSTLPATTLPATTLPALALPATALPMAPPEPPSDVLTPEVRRNTPNLKVGLRAGFNRTAYSNDRYLNNTLIDVGDVSGETDVYGSAAGFGYQFGAELEYPFNSSLSLVVGGGYEQVHFGNNGAVREQCQSSSGAISLGNSVHTFDATIDYAKLAASIKLRLTKFYFMVGLTTAHPVSSSLTRSRTFGGADCYFPGTGLQTIEESGEVPSVSSLHYAFRLGAGLIYHLGDRLEFSPELTLDFGSNAINKSPNSDIGVYSISAVLRYDI